MYSVHPSESENLLVHSTNVNYGTSCHQKGVCSCLQHLCLPSRSAVLILAWTVIVGILYFEIMVLAAALIQQNPQPQAILSTYDPLPYAVLGIVMMLYPLSGFIADVCFGRLKTVLFSLIILLICYILLLLGLLLMSTISHANYHTILQNQGILVVILAILSLLTFVVGVAGYQANFIQLGLDQLFEAPSHYLGLFIHYAIWAFNFGTVLTVIAPIFFCFGVQRKLLIPALQTVITIIFIILLWISFWKRRLFHSEPGHQNPYKTVYNIIKFVKTHRYPLRRSAFTFNDESVPSRLDFAKERYGGPFTTEEVENVKTLLRIVLVLFTVGPVFSMEVPGSAFVFPLINLHIQHVHPYSKKFCSAKKFWNGFHKMMDIGGIKDIATPLILFPVYIWIVFSLFRKKIPKLFVRLGVGIVISLLGVASLLIIDVVGHSMNEGNIVNQTLSQCMFRSTLNPDGSHNYPTLNMHWAVLIPPNFLLGIGPLLVVTTTLEFISAQSPQSMKGFLVGVFFAIKGLFQFLNSIIIIPLSLKQPWASSEMIEHPPVTNCGFVYLLLTTVTGLIGLILFSLAAKTYEYRKRDEGIFYQKVIEEVYDRYLTQATIDDNLS